MKDSKLGENMMKQPGKNFTGGMNIPEGVFDVLRKAGEYQILSPEGNGNGDEFNEAESLMQEDRKVTGMAVRSGYILDAVGMLYEGDVRGEMYGNDKGGRETVIRFEEGDSLAWIEGDCGVSYAGNTAVSRLILRSRKGKVYGPFGDASGRHFHLDIPENGELKGLCGRESRRGSNGFITALGLIYHK